MESIESKVLKTIKNTKRGVMFFPQDFQKIGSSEAIRLALHRLVKQNFILRVAQGIYVRPIVDELVGIVMPTTEEVAINIAKRDHCKILPTGIYALNALGLSTQVPMNVVLLTDGSPRLIKVGKRTIKFKKTSPKNLLAKGEISKLVIQALKQIGTNLQTESEEAKIIELLKKEKQDILIHDIKLAPVWIQKIMSKAL